MIATIVAQEQDRDILLTAAKGVGLASTPPPQQDNLSTHHTTLWVQESVFCVRREWVILRQGMMADDLALQDTSSGQWESGEVPTLALSTPRLHHWYGPWMALPRHPPILGCQARKSKFTAMSNRNRATWCEITELAISQPRSLVNLMQLRDKSHRFWPPPPTLEFLTKDFPSATRSRMEIHRKENLVRTKTAPTAVSKTVTPLIRGIRFP